jgi:hypothetical protein
MSKHRDRAREYDNAIRKILMDEWDPVVVNHIPEAQDEYDFYGASQFCMGGPQMLWS